MNRQAKIAARERAKRERERDRASRAAEKDRQKLLRDIERARRDQQRALKAFERASATEQKRLAKEAKEAHLFEMEMEAERRNLDLAETYAEIDGLLAATLSVDDYVDLNALRCSAQHPPFDRPDLEEPIQAPAPIPDPEEPRYDPPVRPSGIKGLLARKRHAREVQQAQAEHAQRMVEWRAACASAEDARVAAVADREAAECQRLTDLSKERERYRKECEAREAAAAERDQALDDLITNLSYGSVDAVQEYVSIVLGNSVYPPQFEVSTDFSFSPETAELHMRVGIPGPDTIPTEKSFKYSKSADEIVATTLPQKAQRDRYTSAVHQVALRSLHEVFEADRQGIIKAISLEVGAKTINPATGNKAFILFVAVAAERGPFLELDLARVVPAATLEHLGAALSKDPFGLIAADGRGVRRS
ncbi:MAG: hypothetical protein H6825_16740 [Planctomycetes bacterium]|nr:hypothetical protein [Planctomycetota bacterium]